MRPLYVAVCGGGECSPQEAEQAEAVGRLLAEAGAVVVTGGLTGVMEAASKGAHGAGGTVLGILPQDRHEDANPWCTVVVPTGLGDVRNALIIRTADAVIAVDGEYGTLSEIAFALKRGLPVVGLGTWGLRKNGEEVAVIERARTPDEAVRTALALARSRRG